MQELISWAENITSSVHIWMRVEALTTLPQNGLRWARCVILLLFKIFAALSVSLSFSMMKYVFKPVLKQREWIIEHLGSILGAGIGAYTAFFAFGGSRLFATLLTGNLQVLPWVLPSVIGISASIYFSKKYRKQFRVQ